MVRLEHDLTQKELSEKSGVGNRDISDFEKGKRFPRYDQLKAIADSMDIDFAYLTGDSQFKNKFENINKLFDFLIREKIIEPGGDIPIEKVESIISALKLLKNIDL